MKISVKYYSQHKDVKKEEWKEKSCGIACVGMVLEFWTGISFELDNLIADALKIDAYGPHGWIHEKLIYILHNNGVCGYREEFRSLQISDGGIKEGVNSSYISKRGIHKIIEEIQFGRPVIISAIKNFTEDDKYHMVVLVGLEEDEVNKIIGFYYHDPDALDEKDGGYKYVDIKTFENKWRRFAIFSYK